MRNDRFDVLERFTPVARPPQPSFEKFLRRRDRKRRNQRIAAGVIGVALFLVPAAVVAGRTLFHRSQAPRPAAPGESPRVVAPEQIRDVDHILNLNTGIATPLPSSITRSLGGGAAGQNSQYAASPDGSRLAYVAPGADGKRQIFVAPIDGGEILQMTHAARNLGSPAWSPDGTKIVYQDVVGDAPSKLFILDVRSLESTQIVVDSPVLGDLQFAPGGAFLIYTSGTNAAPVIRLVPVTGGKSRVLIGPPPGPGLEGTLTDAGSGSFSPGGSLITFVGSEEGRPGPQRWLAKANGTGRRAIPGWISNPAGTWSPDGTRIVCAELAKDGTESFIIVVDVATGRATRVADGGGLAIWLDDHTLLVDRFPLP